MSTTTSRDRYLRRKYGITEDEYKRLAKFSGGRCWGCGDKPKPGRNLHVDHDHRTRQVRALLCWQCNQLLRTYATPERLTGLADVADRGTEFVHHIIGHNGNCAPAKRRKKKGKQVSA